MKRVTPKRDGVVIPPGLPDSFRAPSIPLNPAAPPPNRRLQAFTAYARYTRELEAWLRSEGLRVPVVEVQRVLRTTLEDFYAVADSVDPERRVR